MQQTFVALTALAAAASAYKVSIHNNCNEDAYIWSCGDDLGDMETLKAGKTWDEEFYSKQGGAAGPSIYVSNGTSHTDGNIAQFEYYYQESTEKVWWDISLINGNPYPTIGLGSDLSEIPYEACKPVICVENDCDGTVYTDHAQLEGTHDCPPSNLIMKLCDANGDWNGGESNGSSDSDDSSSETPVSSAAPEEFSAAPVASSTSVAQESYSVAPVPEVESTTQAPEATSVAVPAQKGYVPQNKGNDVVMHTAYATTVVTAVVTQTASPAGYGHSLKADSEGSVHAKREAHGHAHAHNARSRVMRHQHSA